MKNLRKILGAWLLVFSMLLGMMPAGFAAGDTEIPLPNGDFENGTTDWTLTGYNEVKTDSGENLVNTTNALNLWLDNNASASGAAAYTTSQLDAGTYYFAFNISGAAEDSGLKYAVTSGESTLAESSTSYTGKNWNQWDTLQTDPFTLSEATAVTFTLSGTQPAGWWGYLDNLNLYKTNDSGENPPAVGYAVTVTASKTDDVKAGDTVTFTAEVTNNGQAVSELAGLDLWFYPDTWKEGHSDGLGADAVEIDTNTGKVLSTDITLKQAGTYYIAAQLKNGDTELAIGFVTVTVTAEEKPPVEQPDPVSANIYVPYVAGSEGDFIRGVDVSSLLSILNSGAHYYNADGTMLGTAGDIDSQGEAFMQLLADSGVNWVRLRIWPDPYDSNHNGYGGGNNDLDAAKRMGKWATDAGIKTLIDFHYSDFWCDPAKQKSPKAWADITNIDERAAKVKEYTMETLNALIQAGVDVRMVQVGNETNNGICGVYYASDGWMNAAKIFAAGCEAVHAVRNPKLGEGEEILAAVHFANPEKPGTFASYAKELNDNNVNYDVFASSYYPYWHGSIENLQNVLSDIAKKYDKKVMVAETSWAWTLEDGDGHDNTVRTGSNDENPAYVFSVQGQATEVATVMKGIADIDVTLQDDTPAGIGVFYWEPAWIPVNDISGLTGAERETAIAENKILWDQYGSGWAASYSVEYDPEDAGLWFGGSAVDNQAVFDFSGKALESLNVFKYVTTGTKDYTIEVIPEALSQEYAQNDTLSLPDEVVVTPSVGDKVTLRGIAWDSDSVSAVQMEKPGTYKVTGTVTGEVAGEEKTIPVTCAVTIRKENFLTQNPSFEDGNTAYTLTNVPGKGITDAESGNARSGTWCLHYYQAEAFSDARVEHDAVTLEPGSYEFDLYTQGMDSSGRVYVRDASGKEIGSNDAAAIYATKGWRFWQVPVTRFTLTERTAIIPGLIIDGKAESWGAADDWYIEKVDDCRHENVTRTERVEPTVDAAGNIEFWHCTNCGKYFSDAACTVEITEADTVLPALGPIAVTGITLEPGTMELDKDETGHLTATVLPENATNKRLIWTVGNPDIAEVDSNGMVTALTPGKTTITVTTEDGGFTAICEFTVLHDLSVIVNSNDENAHLTAQISENQHIICLSGNAGKPDDSIELTLTMELPNGDRETKEVTLSYDTNSEKWMTDPEQFTIGGDRYTLDVSGITLSEVKIETDGAVGSVGDELQSTLSDDEMQAVQNAANSVTGDVESIISGAADELAQAGKDAQATAPEGATVKVVVYMKVEATGYKPSGETPSLKLDITPVYKVVNANNPEEVISAETELETDAFQTPIRIQVTLPEGFVRSADRLAAKHYGRSGSEWFDVQLSEDSRNHIATFFADSFSEYELVVSPTVTAVYHALNGDHTAIYHYARIGRTEIPVTEQQSNRFLGWSRNEGASTAEYLSGSLTQELIDQMYKNLNDNREIHLYPVFREDVIPPDHTGGTTHRRPNRGSYGSAAEYETLSISRESARNGSFSVSPRNPEKGDKVTITVSPDAGYLPDTVTVTDENGRSVSVAEQNDNVYTFTMPGTDVTVAVTFRPDETAPAPDTAKTADFADVFASDWFQNAVNYVSAKGIMAGNGNHFSPNDYLTRGMMAQILYNMAGGPGSGSHPFPDVTANDWFASAVNWAASQGYMSGYGNGNFGPNDPITREQTTAILYRYTGSPAVSGNLAAFTDAAQASAFAETALRWAAEQEILSGKTGGLLDPKGSATRAEIASILMQFCEKTT